MNRKIYTSPELEVLRMEVEAGIAASQQETIYWGLPGEEPDVNDFGGF